MPRPMRAGPAILVMVSVSILVSRLSASSPAASMSVYAGYYDTHHPGTPRPKPSPWLGSPNVVFVGKADPDGGWDTSAIRIVNLGNSSISGVRVTVDIGAQRFALWGTNSIPSHYSLVLAQTGYENVAGSGTNPAGCYTCSPGDCVSKVSSTVPVIRVTIGSTTTRYHDTHQVLNTHGVDASGCPYRSTRNDESESWRLIGTSETGETVEPDPDPVTTGTGRRSGFSHYPSPTSGEVTIRFAVPVAGAVRLAIYDVRGRLVRQVIDGDMDIGNYSGHADLSGEPAGIYFTRLETAAGSLWERVLVVR